MQEKTWHCLTNGYICKKYDAVSLLLLQVYELMALFSKLKCRKFFFLKITPKKAKNSRMMLLF